MTSYAEDLFRDRHPVVNRNIFLMMGFAAHPVRTRIREIVENIAKELDFRVVRADDFDYTGELWGNVRLCMENCGIGIAIFDPMQSVDGQVNIGVELGFMFALRRRCLLLSEATLDAPVAMLAHRLHNPFDMFDIEGSLSPVVRSWLSGKQ